jgi:SAM-dependent methyltransferase
MSGAFVLSPVGDELLDDPAADPRTVAASLRDIAVANRWLGGTWAALHGIARVLHGVPRGSRVTLLDIGTGHGDVPRAAVRWGRRRGIEIVPLGLELSTVAAALAIRAGVPTAVANVAAPPIGERSVDVVLLSQVAHHFSHESLGGLARSCDGLARRGVVIADLRRSRVAAIGFRIGARCLGFDPVTRLDGVTSIRRGFAQAELATLLHDAGIGARVEQRPGFRLVASWRTLPAPAR